MHRENGQPPISTERLALSCTPLGSAHHPFIPSRFRLPHLVAVQRPPSTVGLLAPPRHHVHHPFQLVRCAEGRPVPLDRVTGLPLALRGRAAPASHVDHGGRLVEGAELCLLSLLCWTGRQAGKVFFVFDWVRVGGHAMPCHAVPCNAVQAGRAQVRTAVVVSRLSVTGVRRYWSSQGGACSPPFVQSSKASDQLVQADSWVLHSRVAIHESSRSGLQEITQRVKTRLGGSPLHTSTTPWTQFRLIYV